MPTGEHIRARLVTDARPFTDEELLGRVVRRARRVPSRARASPGRVIGLIAHSSVLRNERVVAHRIFGQPCQAQALWMGSEGGRQPLLEPA